MLKTTLMFGSIGAVMETSDVQRRAYNQALKEAGLPWVWTREIYAELLLQSGGQDRLKMLAAATGTLLSHQQIEHIHSRKTEIACDELSSTRTPLRSGVAELMGHVLALGGIRLADGLDTRRRRRARYLIARAAADLIASLIRRGGPAALDRLADGVLNGEMTAAEAASRIVSRQGE